MTVITIIKSILYLIPLYLKQFHLDYQTKIVIRLVAIKCKKSQEKNFNLEICIFKKRQISINFQDIICIIMNIWV